MRISFFLLCLRRNLRSFREKRRRKIRRRARKAAGKRFADPKDSSFIDDLSLCRLAECVFFSFFSLSLARASLNNIIRER